MKKLLFLIVLVFLSSCYRTIRGTYSTREELVEVYTFKRGKYFYSISGDVFGVMKNHGTYRQKGDSIYILIDNWKHLDSLKTLRVIEGKSSREDKYFIQLHLVRENNTTEMPGQTLRLKGLTTKDKFTDSNGRIMIDKKQNGLLKEVSLMGMFWSKPYVIQDTSNNVYNIYYHDHFFENLRISVILNGVLIKTGKKTLTDGRREFFKR